jgi:hypothetical protein
MSIPTVACCVTSYWVPAHADVIVTKLLRGYDLYGEQTTPRIKVASLYIEQFPENDIGRAIAEEFGVPIFDTIAEAIGVGEPGVNVDGVILIGEHGVYDFNELGQEIYPRRRFFEAAFSTMFAANTFVPIFNDKHLAYEYADAEWMVNTAKRFNIPFVAGSTLPLCWRDPALEYPLGVEGLTEAMVIAYGPLERYGYHALEALQAMVERRAGGETGVAAITTLTGDAVWDAGRQGLWSQDLFDAAWAKHPNSAEIDPVVIAPNPILFLIEYKDGLRGSVFLLDEATTHFSYAARRGDDIDSVLIYAQDYPPYGHFTFLVRKIEQTILEGKSPLPIERVQLSTGMTDYAIRSHHEGGVRLETPLDVVYTAPESIPETGLGHPLPYPPDGLVTLSEQYRQRIVEERLEGMPPTRE